MRHVQRVPQRRQPRLHRRPHSRPERIQTDPRSLNETQRPPTDHRLRVDSPNRRLTARRRVPDIPVRAGIGDPSINSRRSPQVSHLRHALQPLPMTVIPDTDRVDLVPLDLKSLRDRRSQSSRTADRARVVACTHHRHPICTHGQPSRRQPTANNAAATPHEAIAASAHGAAPKPDIAVLPIRETQLLRLEELMLDGCSYRCLGCEAAQPPYNNPAPTRRAFQAARRATVQTTIRHPCAAPGHHRAVLLATAGQFYCPPLGRSHRPLTTADGLTRVHARRRRRTPLAPKCAL